MTERERKIIHIDMDAFFASVEQLDNPKLKGLPIAVGGSGNRGVVSAASYEARKYGVRSAMSGIIAKKICPHIIFVKPRFERYKEISIQIRDIFNDYTSLVEPLSLDEAYLDVSDYPSGTLIAKEIRNKIKEKVGLNSSAGISTNKFLAKIASDWNKPNGQKTISPEEIIGFLEKLDVKKFHGVGEKTKLKMYQLGIFNGKDLKSKPKDFLINNFGKTGSYFYNVSRGIHKSPVKPQKTIKSIGSEKTFEKNLSSELYIEEKLKIISEILEKRLLRNKLSGRTITLKIKYSDFSTQTRRKTGDLYLSSKELIFEKAKDLLYQKALINSVRLIGISINNLNLLKKEKRPSIKRKNSQLSLPF
tara:strand:- start:758 stop:1840 length:1083 start_codon:yes stop_codon:yes gene_type:complete